MLCTKRPAMTMLIFQDIENITKQLTCNVKIGRFSACGTTLNNLFNKKARTSYNNQFYPFSPLFPVFAPFLKPLSTIK